MPKALSVSLLLAVLLVITVALAVSFGGQAISLSRAWSDASSLDATILWTARVPRVALAALAGAALAVVGVAFQALLRNPLADPYVLGVSGGAAAGATLAIVGPAGIGKIAAVRFGWKKTAEPNLQNKEGLPAYPFRTDSW